MRYLRLAHLGLLIALIAAATVASPLVAREKQAKGTPAPPLIHRIITLPRAEQDALRLRILAPRKAGPRPVILFSHGNMLSQADYDPLIRALAQSGFVILAPAHGDAAETIAAIHPNPPRLWRTRIADLTLILDHLDAVDRMLAGDGVRVDSAKIGVAGHSFGAHSAAALIGQTIRDPDDGARFDGRDPRIRAALLLAPPGHYSGLTPERRPRLPYLDTDGATMRGPLLVIAGDRDDSRSTTDLGPRWRMDSYFNAGTADKCLLRIANADHYFGDLARRLDGKSATDAGPRLAVVDAARRFFTASLGPAQRRWKRVIRALPGATCP